MRALAIVFFIATRAYAGAIAEWGLENNYNDSVGSFTLTPAGSITFSNTIKIDGSYSASLAAGNVKNDSVGSGLTSGWSVEGYFYLTNLDTQYLFCLGTTSGSHIATLYNGALRLVVNDTVRVTAGETAAINTWYYWAVVSTASNNLDFYLSPAASISQVKDGSYTAVGAGNWPSSGNSVIFGRNYWLPSAFPLVGYVDRTRVSNSIITYFPSWSAPTNPIFQVVPVQVNNIPVP